MVDRVILKLNLRKTSSKININQSDNFKFSIKSNFRLKMVFVRIDNYFLNEAKLCNLNHEPNIIYDGRKMRQSEQIREL